MATVDELRMQMLGLTEQQRAELAHDLLLSLHPAAFDAEAEEWSQEIERRSAAYKRGETTAADWRQSVARLREELRKRRQSLVAVLPKED